MALGQYQLRFKININKTRNETKRNETNKQTNRCSFTKSLQKSMAIYLRIYIFFFTSFLPFDIYNLFRNTCIQIKILSKNLIFALSKEFPFFFISLLINDPTNLLFIIYLKVLALIYKSKFQERRILEATSSSGEAFKNFEFSFFPSKKERDTRERNLAVISCLPPEAEQLLPLRGRGHKALEGQKGQAGTGGRTRALRNKGRRPALANPELENNVRYGPAIRSLSVCRGKRKSRPPPLTLSPRNAISFEKFSLNSRRIGDFYLSWRNLAKQMIEIKYHRLKYRVVYSRQHFLWICGRRKG